VGVFLRPAVENLGERGGLATARWQVLLEHEYEHDVSFGREVHDVLSNDRPAFAPADHRPVRVFGGSKTNLGDVNRVVTVGVAQEHRGSYGEHLIDKKGAHASNASRCSDVRRLRCAAARLRSIRTRTSSE
jgi:hypothetical protein